MNPAELPLRDIHLPDPVGWWPPAPGWWLVAAVIVLVMVAAWRRWRRLRLWRRSAVFVAAREFERLREGWRDHDDPRRLARELSTWLRRSGMSVRSRREAASLTGTEWWRYLDEIAGTSVFGPDGGRLLTESPYRASADVDADKLLRLCERWLHAVTEQQRRVHT